VFLFLELGGGRVGLKGEGEGWLTRAKPGNCTSYLYTGYVFCFQLCPGTCHSLDDPSVRMSRGDVLHINTHTDDEISPTPEFKSPARPKV
jgi:hypothetical protein